MNNKPELVTSQNVKLDSEYVQWIHEIKQRYRNSQIKAAVKVNSEQLLFNWQLGRDLVVRKAEEKWGSGIIERLSLDFKEAFPKQKGFSTTKTEEFFQLYLLYFFLYHWQ